MRETSDGDWIAVCACGWESDARPLSEIAQGLLDAHVEEAQEDVVAPEAVALREKLDRGLRGSRGKAVPLELTVGEVLFLKRLLGR